VRRHERCLKPIWFDVAGISTRLAREIGSMSTEAIVAAGILEPAQLTLSSHSGRLLES
jgi:hypothetical protein